MVNALNSDKLRRQLGFRVKTRPVAGASQSCLWVILNMDKNYN
jgi:hypothetical protein